MTAIKNLITANSIHSNTGKGIRNSNGGNLEPVPPTITAAGSAGASGTACPGCAVTVYSDAADEGRIFHSTVTATGSGQWSFSGALTGPNVTATVTLIDDATFGSTSEFSEPFVVDNDTDGVNDDVEDGAPNSGDGNSDGTRDSAQGDVASLPNSENGGYVTAEVEGVSINVLSLWGWGRASAAAAAGPQLASVQAIDNPAPYSVPYGIDFPIGFLSFEVHNVAPGAGR